MSKQTFFVHGTNCKSCEVVIERELSKLSDVRSVSVSHAKRQLSLETEGEHEYSRNELNQLLKDHYYTVEERDLGAVKTAINWQRIGAVMILIFSVYIIADRLGLLRLSPSASEPAGFLGIFVIGLIASVSSCTAIVGGLVAGAASKMAAGQKEKSFFERVRPHVFFNVGRVGGFILLGALIGYLGSAIQLSSSLNGLFVVLVAVLMIVIGINLLDVFETPVLAMPKWLAHRIHDLSESESPIAPMILGALTFFLPCGFTQSMQLYALTLQDPVQAGIVMGMFALGTVPALLGIGSATAVASGNTLKKVTQTAGLFVIVLGISNVFNGVTLLGINTSVASTSVSDSAPKIVNGRQEISMRISERGAYEPNILTVQKDVPVDWTVIGGNFLGCADTLVMPAFGVNTTIKTGKNLIKFTPTKVGKYTFSCSMGMIRGTMIVSE